MIWSNYQKTAYQMEPHQHDMHEFFICLNNQGIQHIEGQRCAFQRGRAFMLYSGCKHHIEFMPGVESEFIFVCFDKNHLAKSGYLRLQEQLKNRQIKKCYFSGNTPDYLNFNVETIRLLYKEFSSPGLLQNELIDSLLVQLLVAFLRSTNLEASTINPKIDKKRLKITRLCQRAAMDSSLEITLAQAARKTGTCRSVFAALTKEITGLSWREYILDCRLKKSIDLLATTDMQILQVAFTCHFNNIAYFHRTFLKKYGNTPGKMRRILQQNSFPHILKEFK